MSYNLNDYYDYEEPEIPPQPRCDKCKAFLSWTPNYESKSKCGERSYDTFDSDGNLATYVLESESWEPVAGRQCKRCGNCQDEYPTGKMETIKYNPPKIADWYPVEGEPGHYHAKWREDANRT